MTPQLSRQVAAPSGALTAARVTQAAQILLALALALPFVWPVDPGPSAKTGTMLLAATLWSLVLIAAAATGRLPRLGTAVWGFVALAAVIAAQTLAGRLAYPGQGWMAVLLLLGAALVAGLGLALSRQTGWPRLAAAALLAQGLAQAAIGLVQFVLWQSPALGQWFNAHAPWFYQIVSFPGDGRIYGNLRQPNHYATAVALGLAGLAGWAPRLRPRTVWAFCAMLAWALVVSGSRTGTVHVIVVALLVLLAVPGAWRSAAWRPLLAAPLLYAAWWLGLHVADHLKWISYLDAVTRQIDQPVNARAIIWRNAWQVFQMHPVTGWGWGQIGWGLEQTTLAGRLHPLPLDNIDNAHDLVLQLLATCGVAGTAPVLLLGAALAWRLLRAPWRGGERDAQRGAALLPALAAAGCIALHSLLEYPLWYVYFLFTFAFMLGWGEGVASTAGAAQPTRGAVRGAALAAAALALGLSAKATLDYVRAADVYATTGAAADRARALSRANWFFVPLAEFADAAEVLPDPEDDHAELLDELAQLERASHIWGDPGLLSRRIIVLLRLHRDAQAMALARYTASAFWLYAQRTAADFGPLAAEAGLAGDARVRQAEQILRTAPVLRRVVVPR
ncbi:O-antigen ligase [mine drainage metagenome]|uniref:O-antigen ligase n=1 Tax=mine drainage metagenome TaxID=410659 RepID=A0A1J5RZ73_9ZZZZ